MGKYSIRELMNSQISPMMKQYLKIKAENEDTIIFYRLGDFYEMFFDDALIASKELELTLTGRDCGLEERAPMCGVPFHSASSYISRLIEKGYRVAICEQLEDAKDAKGLVKRDIVRVVTPGTIIDQSALEDEKNNYICSIYMDEIGIGLVFADVSTGELNIVKTITDFSFAKLFLEISKYNPKEMLINSKISKNEKLMSEINKRFSPLINVKEDNFYDFNLAYKKIEERFSNEKLIESGISDSVQSIYSLYGLLSYLEQTQKNDLGHVNSFSCYHESDFMEIDYFTKRNLELTETIREKKKNGSLLGVLDKTMTSMGARLLRHYIDMPLKSPVLIKKRHNAVLELTNDTVKREEMQSLLNEMYDIERLCTKLSYRTANGRDLVSLKNSLKLIPKLKSILADFKSALIREIDLSIDNSEDIVSLIENAIVPDPPFSVKEGGLIKDGYNSKIDEYRKAMSEGRDWIAQIEQQERDKTGIKNLKIGYNKVFGYYLEVTRSNLNMVPDYFVRKQTLSNCERYITSKLKEIENLVIGAEEKSINLEYEVFCEVREELFNSITRMQLTAKAIAKLDVLISFANVAYKNHYVMPEISTDGKIIIKDGRHPVVEQMIESGSFIPNDTYLDLNENCFSIITGPNMAGKSTYMRQVALIVLMAQIGSFVPCKSASLPIVDKIFTRVGASDDLASGQSTFMVEMTEVANILQNATKDSLIILDEIGRGTSTFDGLSIAWAVVEYILNKIGAKTLFATHYHELTILEDKLKGIKNYSVAVKKRGEDITFLRKIVEGGTDDSYGIEVAKLAGVPKTVVKRAYEIVKVLESKEIAVNDIDLKGKNILDIDENDEQIELKSIVDDSITKTLRTLDVSTLTPIEALNILYDLSNKAKEL